MADERGEPSDRDKTAEELAKLTTDKARGKKVKLDMQIAALLAKQSVTRIDFQTTRRFITACRLGD